MFTPQEIQEKTFVKAVFGGYDMQTVDEFLEPLTEDYITLYKENAVLKSKMKILVEKLEEYRSQEQSMRKAILSAQRTADAMVAEAEKKCARLMSEARESAQTNAVNADALVAKENERVNSAKEAARSFIEKVEADVRAHLALLEELKKQDLTPMEAPKPVQRQKPYNYEDEAEKPLVVPKAEQPRETTQEIADTIEQSIGKLMDMEDPAPTKIFPADSTIKFTNLQFGKNYDPTNG